jgi:hypothetical protein
VDGLWLFSNGYPFVRFEVYSEVAMKNIVYWDVTSFGSCRGSEEHSVSIIRVTGIGEL